MARYAIGDIHGCYSQLIELLSVIDFNPGVDTIWLVGDLVNRGPNSLACIKWAQRHQSSVRMVLGNHDLHLLAMGYGKSKPKKKDTLSLVLNHRQYPKMRDWLRAQPLMWQDGADVLVHAGLWPDWTVSQALERAEEVQALLRTQKAPHFFAHMYGKHPNRWSNELDGMDRLRCITHILTCMRVLHSDGTLNFDFKSVYADIPKGAYAWFDAPNRQNLSHTAVCGHWSALGLHQAAGVLAIDTGALWGGMLTAVDLDTREIWQVSGLKRQ